MLTLCFVSYSPEEHPGLALLFPTLNITHNLSLFSQGSESRNKIQVSISNSNIELFSVKWYIMLVS